MRMSSGLYSWPLRRISRPRGWPRSTRSHTSHVFAAALVLLVGVAAAAPFSVIGKSAPDFTLTSQASQRIRLSQFRSEVVLLNFIYTHCVDVCPIVTASLVKVQQALISRGWWGKDVVFVSVTTDPARDTPAALRRYTKVKGADTRAWHFLTGTPKALTEVYRAYGISIRSRPGGLQDHHLPTFVIDRRGIVLGAYGVSLRPQDVVKDLEQLVGQRTRGPSPPPALPSAPVSPSPPVATAPPAAHTVRLVAREFSFEPSEVTAPSGEVVFSVHNDGEIEHTFVLEDGARRRLAEISSIPVGETRDRRVDLAPGSYTIFCVIPGHREAGMVARLRVGN